MDTFVILILKVDMTNVPSFILILYSFVPEIEICPKYFLDKNCPKTAIVPYTMPEAAMEDAIDFP